MDKHEELIKLLNEQGKAFSEFRAANDKRLEKLENGEAVADLTAQCKTISEVMNKQSKLIQNLEDEIAKSKTPVFSTEQAAEAQRSARVDSLRRAFAGSMTRVPAEYVKYKAEVKTTVDADGGYATLDAVDSDVTAYLSNDNVMMQLARVAPYVRNYKKLITVSPGEVVHGVEGQTYTAGETAKLKQQIAHDGKLVSIQRITEEGKRDMFFDPENWVEENISMAFSDALEADVIKGTGASGQTKGFLTYDMRTEADSVENFGTIQKIITGKAGGFADTNPLDVLKKMKYMLKTPYRKNASWLMSSSVALAIQEMKDVDGRYLWSPQLIAGEHDMLFGHAVYISDEMPVMAAGSLSLALADWKRALRIGIINGTYFKIDDTSDSAYPDTVLKFSRAYDLTVTDPRAIKVLAFAAA